MATAARPIGPLTYDDVQEMPEDGNRHELLDGWLLVSPAPSRAHQDCVLNVALLFKAALPPDLHVIIAPFDWLVEPRTFFEPDVLVARRADVGPARLETAPMLVVEVASPSTRRRDRAEKQGRYEAEGVSQFWIVDPDVPRLTVLELRDGRYVEGASVEGDERYEATEPFPVSVVPASLLL